MLAGEDLIPGLVSSVRCFRPLCWQSRQPEKLYWQYHLPSLECFDDISIGMAESIVGLTRLLESQERRDVNGNALSAPLLVASTHLAAPMQRFTQHSLLCGSARRQCMNNKDTLDA